MKMTPKRNPQFIVIFIFMSSCIKLRSRGEMKLLNLNKIKMANREKVAAWPEKMKVLVTGAGGFIGSHLAKRLKEEGHHVVAADWKRNEYMKESEFCDEFLEIDLRKSENCEKACEGKDWVFNLAADMGGMGFIQSNNGIILYPFHSTQKKKYNIFFPFFPHSFSCFFYHKLFSLTPLHIQ